MRQWEITQDTAKAQPHLVWTELLVPGFSKMPEILLHTAQLCRVSST